MAAFVRVSAVLLNVLLLAAQAQASWRVLVLPQYDSLSLDTSNSVYAKVGDQIQDSLRSEFELDVLGGVSGIQALTCAQVCTDAERRESLALITGALPSLRQGLEDFNPIDLVVFYHIVITDMPVLALPGKFSAEKQVRVSLTAHDLETGRMVALVAGDHPKPEVVDRRQQVDSWLTQVSIARARDSAALMGELIRAYERGLEYRITLQDFTPDELSRFEHYLRTRPELQTATLILHEASAYRRQWLHQVATNTYHLKTHLGSGALKGLIDGFFRHNGMAALKRYQAAVSGPSSLTLSRDGVAYLPRYLWALALTVLMGFAAMLYRRQHRVFSGPAMAGKARELVAHRCAAETAIQHGQAYLALHHLDAALSLLDSVEGRKPAQAQSLQTLRRQAEALIEPILHRVELGGALAGTTLLGKPELLVGRTDSAAVADIAIDFKRISRAGKQCRLQVQGPHFVLTDQNSTHGTALNGRFLAHGEQVVIRSASVLALGGERPESRPGEAGLLGLCRLLLQPLSTDTAALRVRLDQDSIALLDPAQLSHVWPAWRQDLARTWVCFSARLAVSMVEGRLSFGLNGTAPVLFWFTWREDVGLGIEPGFEPQGDDALKINGVRLLVPVPLQSGCEICIQGFRLGISRKR